MSRYDVLEQCFIQRHSVRHVECFTSEELALVHFGALQRMVEAELPFFLVDGVHKHVPISGCAPVLRWRRNEMKQPRTEQLFGCDGIMHPSFCYDGGCHRHRAEELFGSSDGFDD